MIPPSEQDTDDVIDSTYSEKKENLIDAAHITVTVRRCDEDIIEPANKIIVDSVKLFKYYAAVIINHNQSDAFFKLR
jgi:hypothetical protein